MNYEIQTDHPVKITRQELVLNDKKRSCHFGDFAEPANHKVKVKVKVKGEKIDK